MIPFAVKRERARGRHQEEVELSRLSEDFKNSRVTMRMVAEEVGLGGIQVNLLLQNQGEIITKVGPNLIVKSGGDDKSVGWVGGMERGSIPSAS